MQYCDTNNNSNIFTLGLSNTKKILLLIRSIFSQMPPIISFIIFLRISFFFFFSSSSDGFCISVTPKNYFKKIWISYKFMKKNFQIISDYSLLKKSVYTWQATMMPLLLTSLMYCISSCSVLNALELSIASRLSIIWFICSALFAAMNEII